MHFNTLLFFYYFEAASVIHMKYSLMLIILQHSRSLAKKLFLTLLLFNVLHSLSLLYSCFVFFLNSTAFAFNHSFIQ